MGRYGELSYRLTLLSKEFPELKLQSVGRILRQGKHYDLTRLELGSRSPQASRICIGFGTHGDEDLGLESVCEFLSSLLNPAFEHPLMSLPPAAQRERLRERIELTLYFFNPAGFDKTVRTNGRRFDLNRWFGKSRPPREVELIERDLSGRTFDACIDIHGDGENRAFFMYERTRLAHSVAQEIIDTLRQKGIEIVADGPNGGEEITDGVVTQPPYLHTFDDYLFFKGHVPLALTFEYPGKSAPTTAVADVVLALYEAMDALTRERAPI